MYFKTLLNLQLHLKKIKEFMFAFEKLIIYLHLHLNTFDSIDPVYMEPILRFEYEKCFICVGIT